MEKVLFEKDGRIGRITLNRPEVMNAIDDDLPCELAAAVAQADHDRDIHVIVLSGAGNAFCAGYDLTHYAKRNGSNKVVQDMPWDPMQDFQCMWANTQAFMSLFRAMKPVICKVHGFAVAGGSDIALCADLTIMGDTAQIGYMPTRVWGCPTTAMWVHRLGPEKAKRMMFTGDKITGVEAAEMGLVLKSVPDNQLDAEGRSAGRPYGIRADQPTGHAEDGDQRGGRRENQRDAAPCHRVRRHHSPFARRHKLQSPRGASRLEAGGAGTRHRDLRLDPQQAL
jgi:enoyl-CoA hydratase